MSYELDHIIHIRNISALKDLLRTTTVDHEVGIDDLSDVRKNRQNLSSIFPSQVPTRLEAKRHGFVPINSDYYVGLNHVRYIVGGKNQP